MKSFIRQLGFLSLVLFLTQCSSILGTEPESDVEYTISGTLYKGMSDIPRDNAPILLQGVRREPFGNEDYTTLGQTTTNEDGWFSFTYKKMHEHDGVQFDNGHYVQIRTDGDLSAHIETLPWNTSLSKDFAEVDHSRAQFEINVTSDFSENDTLFLICHLLAGADVRIVNLPGYGDYPVVVLPLTEAKDGQLTSDVIIPMSGSWDLAPNRLGVGYGFGFADLMRSVSDSTQSMNPEAYNVRWTTVSGFPRVDTIKLEL